MSESENKMHRREFLIRSAQAGVAIAAAGGLAYLAYDRKGPAGGVSEKGLVTLPSFAVPNVAGQSISIVGGADRVATVNRGIEMLGGIGRFVKAGDIVVIKPNVAFSTPAFLGATTNPGLVAEVARLCIAAGAKEVMVADNPINDPASCFTISGISKVATEVGAKVVLPKDNNFKNTTLAGGKLIKNWPLFYSPFERATKVIGIAPVKHHSRSGASMTMKNWYGLLGGRRNMFHQDINNIIMELAMLIKPTLVILDGTETMVSNGPTGGSVSDLKRTYTMIVSCDMVAADAFGSTLLGLKPENLPYLVKAMEAGVGTADYESLKPLRASLT